MSIVMILILRFGSFYLLWFLLNWKGEKLVEFFKAFTDKKAKHKAEKELERELEEKLNHEKPKPKKKTDWFPSFGKKQG